MPATVLVTASAGAFPGLAEALRAIPVGVEEVPLMTFAPPLDWGPVDTAVRDLGRYAAVAFTSPRSARAFAERVAALGGAVAATEAWAAGAGTAQALGVAGCRRGARHRAFRGAARDPIEQSSALPLWRHSPGRAAGPPPR